MKAIALVWTLTLAAAVAVAQSPKALPAASDDLAAAIAVEEQERDLAKAERLYREALAGTKLSADARVTATERLAGVLVRLGRTDDAKQVRAGIEEGAVVTLDDIMAAPQDRQREAALRAKAQELVKQSVGDGTVAREPLLWIGEAAVPEIIAYLQTLPGAGGYSPEVVRRLLALMWEIGGPQAAAFLRDAEDHELLAPFAAATGSAARSRAMIGVAEQYLRASDDRLSMALLQPGARRLFTIDQLTEALGRGTVAQRAWLLKHAASEAPTPGLLAIVQQALASTDPELGTLAQRVLNSPHWQGDLRTLDLQLEAGLDTLQFVPDRITAQQRIDAERARRWFELAMAAQRRMGAFTNDARERYLMQVLVAAEPQLDASVVPQVLHLIDDGYPAAYLLRDKITTTNATEVFARFRAVSPDERRGFLDRFVGIDLPAVLLPQLIAAADEGLASRVAFAAPVGCTGQDAAAAWLLAGWQAEDASDLDGWAWGFLELGRRNRSEVVRAAMRTVAAAAKGELQSMLCLALLSMRDTTALAQMTNDIAGHVAVEHPYAKRGTPPTTPLAYVLHDQPSPPHGFTTDELLAFVRTIAAWEGKIDSHAPSRALVAARVPTEIVLALARHSEQGWGNAALAHEWFDWDRVAAARIGEEEALDGPLHRWLDEQLRRSSVAMGIVAHLGEREVRQVRPHLDAMLAGENAELAEAAFDKLRRVGLPMDFEALLSSKHRVVAERAAFEAMECGELSIPSALLALTRWPDNRDTIATYLGAKVAVDGVPALLRLLQDPEKHVRERAAEALTRIRFHHEQQAHWDRVTKGLDASPASAAEKLLLQAKPGAPKAQRLLAIVSLGTLGVPEALPFLIDWTQDPDPEVAQKAKDAIARIHLEPRR